MRFAILLLLATCVLYSVVTASFVHPRNVVVRATTSSKATSTSTRNSSSTKTSKVSSSSTRSPTPTRSPTSKDTPQTSKETTQTSRDTSQTSPSPTSTPESTNTPDPTPSLPENTSGANNGLSQSAKIGLGVGIPLAVAALGGVVAAYLIGKRRGRKRRVSDPTAGASHRIRDPSDELNILRPSSDVAELPSYVEGAYGHRGSGQTWWKSPTKIGDMPKYAHVASTSPPRSPQELPA